MKKEAGIPLPIDSNQLEHWYWTIRQVLQTAQDELESPHFLWRNLNELSETCLTLEKMLDIANPFEERQHDYTK